MLDKCYLRWYTARQKHTEYNRDLNYENYAVMDYGATANKL